MFRLKKQTQVQIEKGKQLCSKLLDFWWAKKFLNLFSSLDLFPVRHWIHIRIFIIFYIRFLSINHLVAVKFSPDGAAPSQEIVRLRKHLLMLSTDINITLHAIMRKLYNKSMRSDKNSFSKSDFLFQWVISFDYPSSGWASHQSDDLSQPSWSELFWRVFIPLSLPNCIRLKLQKRHFENKLFTNWNLHLFIGWSSFCFFYIITRLNCT